MSADNLPATTEEKPERLIVHDDGHMAALLDTAKYEHLWRLAQMFASSSLVPEAFQNNPANCLIGLQMAIRCGVDGFMFLQNCHVIHGKPGIEAKLAIALLNASGQITGKVQYEVEGTGKEMKCTASVIDKETGEVIEHTLSMQTAHEEGWFDKKGSKWKTDPELMIRYRSAMRLCRLHYPDVLLGMYSKEEAEEIATVEGHVLPAKPVPTSGLNDRLKALPEVQVVDSPLPVDTDNGKTIEQEVAEAEAKEQAEPEGGKKQKTLV